MKVPGLEELHLERGRLQGVLRLLDETKEPGICPGLSEFYLAKSLVVEGGFYQMIGGRTLDREQRGQPIKLEFVERFHVEGLKNQMKRVVDGLERQIEDQDRSDCLIMGRDTFLL